jgi:gluconate 2-dehydrogenase subunit 3-like protein
MTIVRNIMARSFRLLEDACLAVTSRSMGAELARREGHRGHGNLRWFTADETTVAEALASVVVPSDEESPGLEDVGVFGPPAIVALDTMVAASAYRRQAYSRGLLAFDTLALRRRNCRFANLPKADQIALFEAAQYVYEGWMTPSAMKRAGRKMRSVLRAKGSWYFAASLFPQIRDDCIQIFYTSRECWTWLEYDGPPMDQGYPNLTRRE